MSPVFCPCFTDGAACRLMSDEVSTYSLFATCTPGILNITLFCCLLKTVKSCKLILFFKKGKYFFLFGPDFVMSKADLE